MDLARPRLHANLGDSRIGFTQIEDCELSKEFINLHIGNRALEGPFIRDGSSRVSCSIQSWVAEYANLLQRKAWLDMRMRKREVSTYGVRRGGLGLGGDSQSNPGIVVNIIIAMLV